MTPSAQAALQALDESVGCVGTFPLDAVDLLRQFIEGAERDRVDAERYRFGFHCALAALGALTEWSAESFRQEWLDWLRATKDEMPDGTIEEGINAAIAARSAEQKGKT